MREMDKKIANKGKFLRLSTLKIVAIGMFLAMFVSVLPTETISAFQVNSKDDSKKSESVAPAATLVENGYAAITSTGRDGPTLRVIDITQFGTLHDNTANHAPADSSGSAPLSMSWNESDFQVAGDSAAPAVYGLALSADGTTIYTATHGFFGNNRTPRVFKIGPVNSTPSVLATLPSPGNWGIGNIDFDEDHGYVFAPNQDDGIIYRIDANAGGVVDSYDPGVADASGADLPPLGERVVGVGYNRVENRLYYGVWTSDGTNGLNTVRSIGLTATGGFDTSAGSDRLEITLDARRAAPMDFEFDKAGTRMLIAENGVGESDFNGTIRVNLAAHTARGLEYAGSTGSWVVDSTDHDPNGQVLKYEVGTLSGFTNSRGGTAWGYDSMTGNKFAGDETFAAFTGDTLRFSDSFVYGVQYTPTTGGGVRNTASALSNSIIADLDYDTVNQDKAVYGEIDIRKQTFSVGNRLWFDTDNDGIIDAGEEGISGASVSIFVDNDGDGQPDSGTAIETVTTDANGYYRFDGLLADNYVIRVNPSNFASGGVLEGYQNTSNVSTPTDDSAESSGSATNADNGVNPATPNAVLTNGVLSNSFALGGTETTTEADVPTSGDFPGQGALDNNADMTVDFGFYGLSLSGTVWSDIGANGNNSRLDSGESLLSGYTVQLFDSAGNEINVGPDGILGTADDAAGGMVTDGSGNYNFQGLPAGDYRVVLTPNGATSPNGAFEESDPNSNREDNDNGFPDNTGDYPSMIISGIVTLTPGDDGAANNNDVDNSDGSTANPTVDFGLVLSPTAAGSSIAGRVKTAFGRGISRTTVTVLNLDTFEEHAVITNHFGYFKFNDLQAGETYVVSAQHRYFEFEDNNFTFTLQDNVAGLTFVGGVPRKTKRISKDLNQTLMDGFFGKRR